MLVGHDLLGFGGLIQVPHAHVATPAADLKKLNLNRALGICGAPSNLANVGSNAALEKGRAETSFVGLRNGDLGLYSGDGLAGGPQFNVALRYVGREKAAVFSLTEHFVDNNVEAGQIFEDLEIDSLILEHLKTSDIIYLLS